MNILQNLIVLGIILNITGIPLAIAEPSPYQTITVTLTAYSSTTHQTDSDPWIAASGKVVEDGFIAANFLPFGAKVIFPELFNDKEFIVEDRMNRRYDWRPGDSHLPRADIWMETTTDAKKFGIKRNVKMLVLELPAAVPLDTAFSTIQNQPAQKTPEKSGSL